MHQHHAAFIINYWVENRKIVSGKDKLPMLAEPMLEKTA
jgi:hypothetical protein